MTANAEEPMSRDDALKLACKMLIAADILEGIGREYGYRWSADVKWTSAELRYEAEQLGKP